jgi:hypothetical protein
MTAHRRSRWCLVVLVALLALPANLLALGQTPVSGETQLYIGHGARLTAQIPAGWEVMQRVYATYGDQDGLFGSNMMRGASLQEVCSVSANSWSSDGSFSIDETVWNDAPACEIVIPSSIIEGIPLSAMILTHPEPFNLLGEMVTYVEIFSTPEHLDEILSTVSFDLSDLTGPEITHSLLDTVEVHAFHNQGVKWDELRAAADDVASPNAVSPFNSNRLLAALSQAGDRHSFLRPEITLESGRNMFPGPPSGEMRGPLGYIEIPAGAPLPDELAYIEGGIDTVIELEPQACGWIIDLRDNVGGTVSIMLQPLLPFFPQGSMFGAVDAAGNREWIERDGNHMVVRSGDLVSPYLAATDMPFPDVANPHAPIAVLIGPGTTSAGELTLVALHGRENTRSFGQPTAGVPTFNIALPLLDGATLGLEVRASIDTDGNVYTGKLQPDEWVTSQSKGGDAQGKDGTIVAAEKWLLEQPACQDIATPVN